MSAFYPFENWVKFRLKNTIQLDKQKNKLNKTHLKKVVNFLEIILYFCCRKVSFTKFHPGRQTDKKVN